MGSHKFLVKREKREREKMHAKGQPCLRHKPAPHYQKEDDAPLLMLACMVKFGNQKALHVPLIGIVAH